MLTAAKLRAWLERFEGRCVTSVASCPKAISRTVTKNKGRVVTAAKHFTHFNWLGATKRDVLQSQFKSFNASHCVCVCTCGFVYVHCEFAWADACGTVWRPSEKVLLSRYNVKRFGGEKGCLTKLIPNLRKTIETTSFIKRLKLKTITWTAAGETWSFPLWLHWAKHSVQSSDFSSFPQAHFSDCNFGGVGFQA